MRAFILDPDVYRAEHAARIVPLLTQRGEQCRKARDLPGAAADYNRALAYAPQDPTLLRLISRMQRGRAARGAILAVFSAAAGVTVLGTAVMAFKKAAPSPDPPVSTRVLPAPSLPAVPTVASAAASAPAPSASAVAAKVAPLERQPRHQVEAGPAAVQYRKVAFVVVPKSALVSIDDGPAEERFLEGATLPVGPHMFHAQGPPRSKCCKELHQKVEIKPDDGSGTPQQIFLSLKFNEAQISSSSAPETAEIRCPVLKIAGKATQVYSVRMSSSEQDVNCAISIPGVPTRESSVTLRAGELTEVPWNAP